MERFIVAFVFVLSVAVFYLYESIVLWRYFRFAVIKHNRSQVILHLKKPRSIVIHAVAVIGLICMAYAVFIEPYWIQVNHITLKTSKLKNTTFTIVHFSDLHCISKVRNEKKLLQILEAIQPDIIVFTGDALTLQSGLDVFQDTLTQCHAPYGKYAVNGNWELESYPHLDVYADTGFNLLNGQMHSIEKEGETITISGLDFSEGPRFWQKVIKYLPEDAFNIFLFHGPGLIEYSADRNIDLYLTGHTHGGQVCMPIYGSLIIMSHLGKRCESGLYELSPDKHLEEIQEDVVAMQERHTYLYVNRGLGTFIPIRFLARPEITVYHIEPMKD